MPRDALWLDLHRVDVWELLVLPTRWHSSSEAKPARKSSMRELGTVARDRKQTEEKLFQHGRTSMACTSGHRSETGGIGGKGETRQGSRSEVRGFRNSELRASDRACRARRAGRSFGIAGVHHAGCSKSPSSKAAASEEARRYIPHFVWAVRHCNGSWRTEKPLQHCCPRRA